VYTATGTFNTLGLEPGVCAGSTSESSSRSAARSKLEDIRDEFARQISRPTLHKNNIVEICADAHLEKTLHSQYYLMQRVTRPAPPETMF
jgi:hypothetical protein